MPAKKKGRKKKKVEGLLENAADVVRRLFKRYDTLIKEKNSIMSSDIRKTMKDCIENEQLIVRFILRPNPSLPDSVSHINTSTTTTTHHPDTPRLDLLMTAIRNVYYKFIKDLFVWDVPIDYVTMADLALLIERKCYPIRLIELSDCDLDSQCVGRLAKVMNISLISYLSLDYNDIGDDGCRLLCKGLVGNRLLLRLSLCYCDLGVESGRLLGDIVSTTALRELYLNGNNLECEGVMELIKMAADNAESEYYVKLQAQEQQLTEEEAQQAQEKSVVTAMSGNILSMETDQIMKPPSASKKKKKKGKKKVKEPPAPPPVGPWIYKLHVADNGIDYYDINSNVQTPPLTCMIVLRKLIAYSECLQEVDIDDNLVGDLSGLEVLHALQERKEMKLPSIKLSISHRMKPETFNAVRKISGAASKRKKKKGKGKKRKK